MNTEPSALDGSTTVVLGLPSEQAIEHPRSPKGLVLMVRALERKLEIYATGIALPAHAERTVLRFDALPLAPARGTPGRQRQPRSGGRPVASSFCR